MRFFIIFATLVVVLFSVEVTYPIQNALVVPFTSTIARTSADLIGLWDAGVFASGKIIRHQSDGFAISVEAGCNGVEAGIILTAAIVAFPSSWLHKVVGITVGLASLQALNIARIISLFYLGRWNQSAFEWAHLYIWQALIMLDVLIAFLIWLRFLPRPATRPLGASGG